VKLNDLLALAERSFHFLLDRGFELRGRSPATTDSFRDGWSLDYHAPSVDVRVEYLEAQFNVLFRHAGTTASYLMIDRELHASRSGLYGDMFPSDKLAPTLERVAGDIEAHYSQVLAGDSTLWAKVKRLVDAPAMKEEAPLRALSNKRLKLAGGDRFKGNGVLCPGGHGLSSTTLAPASKSPAA